MNSKCYKLPVQLYMHKVRFLLASSRNWGHQAAPTQPSGHWSLELMENLFALALVSFYLHAKISHELLERWSGPGLQPPAALHDGVVLVADAVWTLPAVTYF